MWSYTFFLIERHNSFSKESFFYKTAFEKKEFLKRGPFNQLKCATSCKVSSSSLDALTLTGHFDSPKTLDLK